MGKADMGESLQNELDAMAREISETYEELTLLYRLSQKFSTLLDMDELLHLVNNEIFEQLNVDKIFLLLIDEESGNLKIASSSLEISGGDISDCAKITTGLAMDATMGLKLILDNKVAKNSPDFIFNKGETGKVICTPLKVKNKPIGTLNIYRESDKDDFTSKDFKLVEAIANQAASSIANCRLYKEMHDMLLGIIKSLISTLEAKTAFGSGHSGRVAIYSKAIADEMGLSNEEKEDLQISAILHDVGKIGLNDSTLESGSDLTTDEMVKLMEHPLKGSSIIKSIKRLGTVTPGIMHHHEFFDGSGYPDGLKGNAIPLQARIIAVANDFEKNAYILNRKGLTNEMAVEKIKGNSGTLYDPDVVRAFLTAHEKNTIPKKGL
ncbi:MAG TPA: HD domain-containing protein [Actinobacteria bacterium]|nr:HD domain-containing protein [Actinomycetota bacterium]